MVKLAILDAETLSSSLEDTQPRPGKTPKWALGLGKGLVRVW